MVRYYPADKAGLDSKSPINNPDFTGNPQVLTPAAGDSDLTVANTQFVRQEIDSSIAAIPAPPEALKKSCYVTTTENILLFGEQLIDGKVTSTSRVLVKDQTDGTQNGLWLSAVGAWTRVADADETPDMMSGMLIFVENGYLNEGQLFVCTNKGAITLGTTALTFVRVIPQRILYTGKTIASPLYMLVGSDSNRRLEFTYESEKTLMVMPNDIAEIPLDTEVRLLNLGAGKLIITAGADVIINSYKDVATLRQYEEAVLVKRAYPNTWILSGFYAGGFATIPGTPGGDPGDPGSPGDPIYVPPDFTPPDTPGGLVLTSFVEQLDNGQQQVRLVASCNVNAAADLFGYTFEIKEGTGNYVGFLTNTNRYEWVVKPGVTYTVRVLASDVSGNRSPTSDPVEHTAAKDEIPPGIPASPEISAGINSLWVSWVNPNDSDLSYIAVYENTVDDPDTSVLIDTVRGQKFARTGLSIGQTRYYWLKAVDTSGNESDFSEGVSGTTASIPEDQKFVFDGVTFKQNDGAPDRLSWTAGTISYGQAGFPPTEQAITAGFYNWTEDTAYIYYVRGDTTLSFTTTLADVYAAGGFVMAVYKGNLDLTLVEGNAYVNGAMILAQTIGANQLVTGEAVITGSAQIADAIVTNAKILDLSAAKLTAGTALAGSITVSGTALSTVSSNAALGAQDPATRVNAGVTQINPGKILLSGGTSLSSWQKGGDLTKIDGGAISADTVDANKMRIGQRGVTLESIQFEHNSPTANRVSWTAGTIRYVDDTGTVVSSAITANAGGTLWSTGVLFIYWVKGATALSTTTNPVTASSPTTVVLATYQGGTLLDATYGQTVIDGSNIKTGSITADRADIANFRTNILIANAISSSMLQANVITAREMVITNYDNLIADPYVATPGQWAYVIPGGTFRVAATAGYNNRGTDFIVGPGANGDLLRTYEMDCETGDSYEIVASARFAGSAGSSQVRCYIRFLDGNGASAGSAVAGTFTAADTVHGILRSVVTTVPATAVKMRVHWDTVGTTTTVNVSVEYTSLRKRYGGNLIVDGAIAANHIVAGTITATQLAAGAITAGKINAGAINASSLFVNGVVVTGSLAANAVTQSDTASFSANSAADTGSFTQRCIISVVGNQSGTPVLVFAQMNCTRFGGASTTMNYRLVRTQSGVDTVVKTVGYSGTGTYEPTFLDFGAPAGNFTYRIDEMHSLGGGGTVTWSGSVTANWWKK